jgi:hypothetical protein
MPGDHFHLQQQQHLPGRGAAGKPPATCGNHKNPPDVTALMAVSPRDFSWRSSSAICDEPPPKVARRDAYNLQTTEGSRVQVLLFAGPGTSCQSS